MRSTLSSPARPSAISYQLLAILLAATASAQTLQTLLTNGPSANRVNLVFLAEGYTTAQPALFFVDATNALNNLLAAPPYNSYRHCFNAVALFVPSNQPGSSHPSQNTNQLDTYFHSSYDSFGKPELLTIPPNNLDPDPNHGTNLVANLLQTYALPHDMVIVLVNDLAFGGSDIPGLPVMVVSKCACISSPELIVHESGHALGGLGDEYTLAKTTYPDIEEPNTTTQTNRALIKWAAWINTNTPVPTIASYDFGDVVGLFQGAHYHTNNWFRPKYDCMMNNLQVPFCEVCSEQLVKSLYARVRPVDGVSPVSPVSITTVTSVPFNLTLAQSGLSSVQVVWKLDGLIQPAFAGTSLLLQTTSLSNGAHTLSAEFTDATPLVRSDPQNLLRQTNTWSLTVNIPGH